MNDRERQAFRLSSEYAEAFKDWCRSRAATDAFEYGDNDEYFDALDKWRARL